MPAGRNRSFDKQQALEAAMQVFWLKGYVGASLTDLTAAMSINKPSMYAAFGNKEQLFIQSMQNYIDNYASQHAVFLAQKGVSFKDRLRNYLLSIIAGQCGQNNPIGCFISVCISESVSEDMPAEALAKISEVKSIGENVLIDFFIAAQRDHAIANHYNLNELADYFVSIMHGTAAMARAGKTKQQLIAVIEQAIKTIS